MKKLIIALMMVLVITPAINAQNNLGKSDDAARISLTPIIPDQLDQIPRAAKKMLANKLKRVATLNGLSGSATNPRFVITANVDILSKDITPTAPPMTALTMQVNVYVADVVAQKIFASTELTVKGVGRNETKAYMSGLKRIAPRNPQLRHLIESGKTKIIEYYNSQCDMIIQDAQTKASMKDFGRAIYTLTSIPDVCKECYDKSMSLVPDIYQQYMDDKCQKDLAKAKGAYGSKNIEETMRFLSMITPDSKCYDEAQKFYAEAEQFYCKEALGAAQGFWASQNADKAAEALAKVSSDCDCYPDAQKLAKEIRTKLKADEKREWENKLKQQDRKYELAKEEQKNSVEIAKARIDAAKSVGEAAVKAGNWYGAYYSNLMWIFK